MSANLSNSPKSIKKIVDKSLHQVFDLLNDFSGNPQFNAKIAIAFGDGANVSAFKTAWSRSNFSGFPPIEIRSAAEINGANGAFAAATGKIYLAKEFLAANANNRSAIASVLLEEYGHYVDSKINKKDAAGDEGKIFALLVQGESITPQELAVLRAEDDTATVTLDGRVVAIEMATINGNNTNETLYGTNDNDSIYGALGNDTLWGRDGNDYLDGEQGNDWLSGEKGRDTVRGGDGDDVVLGGLELGVTDDSANDELWGGNGNDYLDGEQGNDWLSGEKGRDTVRGGDGDDVVLGGLELGVTDDSANDELWGGNGNDYLDGEQGNDWLSGEKGRDTVRGGDGDDVVLGGLELGVTDDSANDTLWGGAGNDYLDGEQGNDWLSGELGRDTVRGGDGDDVVLGGLELNPIGDSANDELWGDAGNDYLGGEQGNDTLWGGIGNDTLNGGTGSDNFVFNSVSDGIDIIQDFSHSQGDKIQIAPSFNVAPGYNLSQFNYNNITGALSFNGTQFATLNTNSDFQLSDITRGSITDMLNALGKRESGKEAGDPLQYVAINWLHFVGKYQFGEQKLKTLGYYDKQNTDAKNDTTNPADSTNPIALDWQNTVWSGKDQVTSLGLNTFPPNTNNHDPYYPTQFTSSDFLGNVTAQENAIRQAFGEDINVIYNKIYENDKTKTIGSYLNLQRTYTPKNSTVQKTFTISMSGILAGSHLVGAEATAAYLLDPTKQAFDENGTSIAQYMDEFGGYQTPFGTDGDESLQGTQYTDVFAGFVGSDTLTGGAGADRFRFYFLNDAGDTITDFNKLEGDKIEVPEFGFGQRLFSSDVNTKAIQPFQFITGSNATSEDHRFIYNQSTGELFFDADGSNNGKAAVKLATLSNKPTLTYDDIVIHPGVKVPTPPPTKIEGTVVDDTLTGSGANETVIGYLGNDRLTGGDGADKFRFSYSNEGVDTITDFNQSQGDKIEVNGNEFKVVWWSNESQDFYPKHQFFTGTSANNEYQRLIYDDSTGNLYFDPDGNGAQTPVHLATLLNAPKLTEKDIVAF